MGKRVRDFDSWIDEYQFNGAGPFKTLINLYRGNGLNLVVSTLFYLIKQSPVWVLPIVTANVINIVSQPSRHSLHEIWLNVVIILGMILQNVPTHALHRKYLSKAVRDMETHLRGALVRRFQQLSISFHNGAESGRLQSKVLRDVEAVQVLSRQLMTTLITGVLSTLVAIMVTMAKNRVIVLFYVVTVPLSSLLIATFRRNIGQKNREFRLEIERMAARVSESIEMIPVTRAHGLEKVEIKRIDSHLEKVQDKGIRLDVVNAVFGASAWVTFQVFQVLCLVFTGYLAYKRRIPVGDIVLYQGFFNTIVNAVSGIINVYPELAKGMESINSIGEILGSPSLEKNQGKRKVAEVRGGFSFQSIGYAYPGAAMPAVRDFSLEVEAGECIAIVGESGAGKTTLLNLIIGFLKPTAGRILLDGADMDLLDLRTVRRHLAVVPQNTILFSGTIRDNIAYGLADVSEERLFGALEMANVKEFLDRLPNGLETPVGEHGGRLSGGQRQRIAIARALIRDPRVIILDEATSSLDFASEIQVNKGIKSLIQGRTTFIVAHRLGTIRDVDRIVVMKNGACVEAGTYAELMARKGEFCRLHSMEA